MSQYTEHLPSQAHQSTPQKWHSGAQPLAFNILNETIHHNRPLQTSLCQSMNQQQQIGVQPLLTAPVPIPNGHMIGLSSLLLQSRPTYILLGSTLKDSPLITNYHTQALTPIGIMGNSYLGLNQSPEKTETNQPLSVSSNLVHNGLFNSVSNIGQLRPQITSYPQPTLLMPQAMRLATQPLQNELCPSNQAEATAFLNNSVFNKFVIKTDDGFDRSLLQNLEGMEPIKFVDSTKNKPLRFDEKTAAKADKLIQKADNLNSSLNESIPMKKVHKESEDG